MISSFAQTQKSREYRGFLIFSASS